MTTSNIPVESTNSTKGKNSYGAAPVIRIRPAKGWDSLDLADLWYYRNLLFMLLWRDVKGRYRQTMLGPIWFVLGPLVRMVVFSVLFGQLIGLPSEGVPYPVFTYTALLPWELFNGAVQRSTGSLVEYMNIISKVYFPRLVVPVAATLSGLVDFAISFVILLGMLVYYGYDPTWRWLVLLPLMLLAMLMALTMGLFLSSLQVRFRDVGSFMGYLLQLWFYATPVVYSADIILGWLPESLHWLYYLNPMYIVIEGFRWALLDTGQAPGWNFAIVSIIVFIGCIAGAFYFRRTEQSIVDIL